MIRVVFVCLGNICRSPMAEAIFRKMVDEAGLSGKIAVDSAGTGDWHLGKGPHKGTREILEQQGIEYSWIRSRLVTKQELLESEYSIAMDATNLRDMKELVAGEPTGYMARLLELGTAPNVLDVPDPYYEDNFDLVFELIHDSCARLLAFIREREGL